MKKMNKKGIVFTIIAVALSAVLIATFFFNIQVPLDNSVDRTTLRIKTINNFIEQMDTFIPAQISASTRATLVEMINETIDADNYFDSFTLEFYDCQRGNASNTACTYGLQDKLIELDNLVYTELSINSTLTVQEIEIYHVDPWYLTTKVNVTVEVSDSYANWKFNKTYETNTSFIGLSDPTYSVNIDPAVTAVNYPLKFNATLDRNISFVESPSTLNIFTTDRHYFALEGAPNFISRMNGDLTNQDTHGIASIVLPNLRPFDIRIAHTDYTYWRQDTCDRADVVFDFWSKPQSSGQIRSRLNITNNRTGESIHYAVIPLRLLNISNLNNTDYFNVTTC